MPDYYDRWNWDYRPAPKAKAGSYRRQYGTTWWGKAFLTALEEMDYSGRLSRGKTYANKGLVEAYSQSEDGQISAQVQGSRPSPYQVTINWQSWTATQKDKISQALISNPAILGRLLAGELPEQVQEVFEALEINLFPSDYDELEVGCSCPDWATPCKHQAAVFYILAGEIDNDPFRLFSIRGLDLYQQLSALAGHDIHQDERPILALSSLYRPVQTAADFIWAEDQYQLLNFAEITAAGWRAVSQLSSNPSFDSANDFRSFLQKVYQKAEKASKKLLAKELLSPATVLVPPGGQVELHLGQDLYLKNLCFFDAEDQVLLDIEGEESILEWFMQVELVERYHLSEDCKSLLLAFQLARTLVARRAFRPQLLEHDEIQYLLRYLPAIIEGDEYNFLSHCYQLISPTILLYKTVDEEFYEFLPGLAAEQLISSIIAAIIRYATKSVNEATPARQLFLLRGFQKFDLLGTEGFPNSIQRWLDQLYLNDQYWQPIFQVTETSKDLLVDILIANKEDHTKTPRPFKTWLIEEKGQANSLNLFKILGALTSYFPAIEDYLATKGQKPLQYSVATFSTILQNVLPTMKALGVEVLLPKALKKLLKPKLGLSVSTSSSDGIGSGLVSLNNILQFSWQAAIGNEVVDEDDFKKLLLESKGLVKLQLGYVYFDEKEVQKLLQKLKDGVPDLKPHERLQALFSEEYDGGPVVLSSALKATIDKWRKTANIASPNNLQAKLRPYQLRGYQWMYANARLGFGSIIADDMGLGKTIQVISLLLQLKKEGHFSRQKCLIIVPTSLLGNWQREIQRFAPSLKVSIYHGPNRDLAKLAEYDLLITTYGTARSDEKKLSKKSWYSLVIDEAQNIKNPTAHQTRAIKKIKATVRVAMSGTPVENSLMDYWSLMDFIAPKYLGSRNYFNQEYCRPIQSEHEQKVANRFRKIVAPFMMRRLKTDKSIIADLPDKVVQTEICQLTAEQAALYESILTENMRQVEAQKEGIDRQGLILKLITALKQCCNHPAQFLHQSKADFSESGKAMLLRDRLSEIIQNGEKTLIFTQYRQMGQILMDMIKHSFGIDALFLHGGSSPKKRDEMVTQFQNDRDCPIFILSIKAGGTGLNLTAANHVIHYDLWWNPAVENQATDRAYRIGQQKTVFVHRLVTEKTFEEKIDQLLQSKQDLADLSVGTGETWIGKLNNKELDQLLRLR